MWVGDPIDEHLCVGDTLARFALERVDRRKGGFKKPVVELGIIEHRLDLGQVVLPKSICDPSNCLEANLWILLWPHELDPAWIL